MMANSRLEDLAATTGASDPRRVQRGPVLTSQGPSPSPSEVGRLPKTETGTGSPPCPPRASAAVPILPLPLVLDPAAIDRLPVLARRAGIILDRAVGAGAPLRYLGVARVFADTLAYRGSASDWVIAPADVDPMIADGPLPIPADVRDRLRRLVAAGVDFPAVYLVHEVAGSASGLVRGAEGHGLEALTPAAARDLVGAAPPERRSQQVSARLGGTVEKVGRAARRSLRLSGSAGRAAGAMAAAPFVLLDPMVIGVVTADGSVTPGDTAAFFLIAEWHW